MLLALTTVLLVRGDEDDDPDAIPLTGRPVDVPFSEASGGFAMQTSVDRTTVQVEDPVVFVVRIKAMAPVRKPPRRLSLSEFSGFAQAFHIEDLAHPAGEVTLALRLVGAGADPCWAWIGGLFPQSEWEFRYRLSPRSTDVKEVPSLPLAFYDPRLQRFQRQYADAIPLEVKPRKVVEVPLAFPEEAFQLVIGPDVLATVRPWSPPGPVSLAFLMGAPPLLCAGWYLIWRRRYPDAARLARARRSRAAQLALDLLRKAPAEPRQRAQVAGRAVTRYLRLRLDLPCEEPTPRESVEQLIRLGLPETMTAAVGRFYQSCDAARFAPVPPAETPDLTSKAAELILELETETDQPARTPGASRTKTCLLFLALLASWRFVSPSVGAAERVDSSNQDIVRKAEEAFAAGTHLRHDAARARPHFGRAAELFEELHARGVRNPALDRDRGNSWLLADDLPRAILAYRQGLCAAPSDRDLLSDLDRARELVIYPGGTSLGRPRQDDRPPWLPLLSLPGLFGTAAVLYGVGWICLTRWWMVRTGRLLLLAVLSLGGALGLAVLVIEEQRREIAELPLVVIAEEGVLLRKGNSLNFPPRYDTPLNRGVEAQLLFQRGDWLQIQLGGGEIGWVPRSLVLLSGCQLSLH